MAEAITKKLEALDLSPSEQKAREYFEKPGTRFTPADAIFADRDGRVHETKTPTLFVGSLLCGRFHITKYIESGAFGRGWICKDKNSAEPNKNMFIKTFRSPSDRPSPSNAEGHERMVRKEIEVLMHSEAQGLPPHPNIVTPPRVHFGLVEVPATGATGEMFFVVTPDLCEGGELYNYLVFNQGIKRFDEKMARYFFKQLAEGVSHMHKHGIFHRDLKLENVVLDSHYVCKIMDFGHAKHASDCSTSIDTKGQIMYETQTFVGTASYQPPELKQGSRFYNPAAFDIWSLGVILFFLVGIEGLAAKGNDFTFISKVKQGLEGYKLLDHSRSDKEVPDNAKFWEFFGKTLDFSKELKHLINGIFDSPTRFSIERILGHKWLQGEMPSHEEVVAALSGRSTGIVERDLIFTLAEKAANQDEALELVKNALTKIAPFKVHGHKIGVCDPPRFAIAVSESRRVRAMWLSGGLDEWLEFRGLLTKKLDVNI